MIIFRRDQMSVTNCGTTICRGPVSQNLTLIPLSILSAAPVQK